jgi:DNA-binding PadR family transcriptional regulator
MITLQQFLVLRECLTETAPSLILERIRPKMSEPSFYQLTKRLVVDGLLEKSRIGDQRKYRITKAGIRAVCEIYLIVNRSVNYEDSRIVGQS